MDFKALIAELKQDPSYRNQITHIAYIPPREAHFEPIPPILHPKLVEQLQKLGITHLYSHQAQAISHTLEGNHVAVVTSTSSGKTLCYNLPVIHTQLYHPKKTALYLFPTKALAQDQSRKLLELSSSNGPRFGLYDGDTSLEQRRSIRRNCHIILTNPDMLHLAILPYHTNWASFFRNLAFVVIDEMHVYRGIFGANVANIIRRLRRICRLYGAVPQFICCSATIGNPAEIANALTGVQPIVVDSDGSPSGEKYIVFWNPPYIGEGERKSSNSESATLFVKLVQKGVRNITFTRARVVAELIYRYAHHSLRESPKLANRIMSYRGGYTPAQRRDIEKGLFEGHLLGVTATNALELGVDIGDLEACIMTGYPGSITSSWQQMGRAGRGRRSSIAILVALANPLDQYIITHPSYILNASNERAIINLDNPQILAHHILCAAYEFPLSEWDYPLFGSSTESILQTLADSGYILRAGDRWQYQGDDYPAANVNIRSIGSSQYTIRLAEATDQVLGQVEESSAFHVLHEGAIYLHQGESYLVQRLDINTRQAFVAPCSVEYYTVPRSLTEVNIKSEIHTRPHGGGTVHFGEVEVIRTVIGYFLRHIFTDVIIGTADLNLPAQSFVTEALWFTFDTPLPPNVFQKSLGLEGGIHALEHAFTGVLPIHALCDKLDIGGAATPLHSHTGRATVFVYDAYPGGVGIAKAAYHKSEELVRTAYAVVSECPCSDGCPSCIQSPRCGNNNFPLDKQTALQMMNYLLKPSSKRRKDSSQRV